MSNDDKSKTEVMYEFFQRLSETFDERLDELNESIRDRLLEAERREQRYQGRSTDVHSEAHWETCWRHACYLSQYIYQDPPPTGGFSTRYPEKMAEVEKYWEVWNSEGSSDGDFNDQDESGLVARLFKVKGYDPDNDVGLCSPTLVFRGTDFEDFRDVAIYYLGRIDRMNTLRVIGPFTRYEPKTNRRVDEWERVLHLDKSLADDVSRQQLIDKGYEELIIFDEYEEITGRLDTLAGAFTNQITEVDYKLTGKLSLLLGKQGDWVNNLRQGLGMESVQYQEAINLTKNIIEEKIQPSKHKKLELTGHSLGGGLASAACAALDKLYSHHRLAESERVKLHAIVFNPAGVHPNTVAPASPSDGDIHVFAVKDEILTSLQNYSNEMPLVDVLFRLIERVSGLRLPTVAGRIERRPGFSPGKTNESWQVPAKGAPLPQLFPLKEQTLLRWFDFTEALAINEIEAVIHKLLSKEKFSLVEKGFAFIVLRLTVNYVISLLTAWGAKTGVELLYQTIKDLLELEKEDGWLSKVLDKFEDIALPDLFPLFSASVDYHGMDYVIATYEHYFGQDAKPSAKGFDVLAYIDDMKAGLQGV